MTSTDNAILHLIRMRRRPKGIKEIAMIFNQDKMPNLQYSIRKLQKSGLITKEGSSKQKKGVRYVITDEGVKVMDAFAAIRCKVLIEYTKSLSGQLPDIARLLELLTGMYDQTARIAATHRKQGE